MYPNLSRQSVSSEGSDSRSLEILAFFLAHHGVQHRNQNRERASDLIRWSLPSIRRGPSIQPTLHGRLEASLREGMPCSQQTKCMAVFYDAYRYWKYSLEVQFKPSKFYTKNAGFSRVFSVTFGRFNLGLPHTFLESMDIIQQCYAFGFLGTYHSLPYQRFRRTVAQGLGWSYIINMVFEQG